MTYDIKKLKMILFPVVIGILSFFVVARFATSVDFHHRTIQSLDKSKETTLALTAATTAASAGITLLPGDIATPIAEELAELSSKFIVVIATIYLEKYLLTLTGLISFRFLIPLGCLLWVAYIFKPKQVLINLSAKLIVFGLAIFLLVPTSVLVSDMIQKTYSSSIQQTIKEATESSQKIEESSEKQGLIEGIIKGVQSNVSDSIMGIENSLNNLIEAFVIMVITCCVIPILVLFLFIWMIKLFTGVNVNVPVKRKLRISSKDGLR